MPIYEYECEACGHTVVEKFFPVIPKTIPDQVMDTCRHCGETHGPFKKILSRPSFHLKPGGVGWAEDGYGGQNPMKVVEFDEP